MDMSKRNNRSFEVTDLIEEAVKNAAARRNSFQVTQESVSELSCEEAKDITGGAVKLPILVGSISTNSTL